MVFCIWGTLGNWRPLRGGDPPPGPVLGSDEGEEVALDDLAGDNRLQSVQEKAFSVKILLSKHVNKPDFKVCRWRPWSSNGGGGIIPSNPASRL